MKKIRGIAILLVCITVLFFMTGFAVADDTTDDDWVTSSGNTYITSGNVGIGTSNPSKKLTVENGQVVFSLSTDGYALKINNGVYDSELRIDTYGASNKNSIINFRENTVDRGSIYWDGAVNNFKWSSTSGDIILEPSGNVGIGTTLPLAKLHVHGSFDGNYAATIRNTHDTNGYGLEIRAGDDDNVAALDVLAKTGTNLLSVRGSGNVGIGTTSPDYKLDVLGTIRAEEVKVETGWSDFVFEDDYNLPSLDHVETFIKENKHLPDIPSAEEVKEQGLSVSEIMAKQMQKIEELTLYLIEMKKENDEIKQEFAELKKQLN